MRSLVNFLAVVAVALLLGACSKESGLLEKIPADVEQVSVVRLKSLLEKMGYKFEGETVTTPAGMSGLLSERFTELLGRLDGKNLCDINEIVVAVKADKVYLCTPVSSEEEFVKATAEDITWGDDKDGFKIGKVDGTTFLLAAKTLWVIPPAASSPSRDLTGELKTFIKSAEKSSVGGLDGVSGALEGADLVTMAVNYNVLGKKAPEADAKTAQWLVAAMDEKDNKILVETSLMEGDGTPVNFPGVKPVNPAVLAYIPGDMDFVAAMGITPEFDWEIVGQLVRRSGDFSVMSIWSMALPFLSSIDGTLMIALAYEGNFPTDPGDLADGNLRFIAMAHLSQEKIDRLLDDIRTMLFSSGMPVPEPKDGVMHIPYYGGSVYLGNVDGYFGVSNFPFRADNQNELAPLFEGKNGALSLDLPAATLFSMSEPGVRLRANMQCEDSGAKMTLELTGTDRPIFEMLLKMSGLI